MASYLSTANVRFGWKADIQLGRTERQLLAGSETAFYGIAKLNVGRLLTSYRLTPLMRLSKC
jgi:hypothetical protein